MIKKFFSLIISCVLTLGILTSCSTETGDNSLQAVLDRKIFNVGVKPDNDPLSKEDDKGFSGFDIDIINEVAKRLNISVNFVPTSEGDAGKALENKTIDCYWSYHEPSRKVMAQIMFIDAFFRHKQVIMTNSSEGIREIIDIKDKRLGYIAGSEAEAALNDANVFRSSLRETKSYQSFSEMLSALTASQIDAVIADDLYINNYLLRLPDNMYSVIRTPLSTADYRVGFRQKDEALKNRIERIIEDMKDDGAISEISLKWFGADITAVEQG